MVDWIQEMDELNHRFEAGEPFPVITILKCLLFRMVYKIVKRLNKCQD